jgi:hypothetical protein
MSDFDLPALEMEARLKDFVSQNLDTINGKIEEFGDKAESHFNDAGKASDAFTDKLDDLGRKIIGLFAAEKAFSFIKEGVAEFQAGALASAKLTQALGFQSEALNKIAEADAKVTLYKKDQLTSGEANLAFYIKDEAQLKTLIPTMEDLAVKTGSLDSAATLIGRTFNSNITTMRGLGIHVDGAAGSHERLDSIVKGLTERFGGQAKALSDSQGEYGQLTKNIEEISKAIGGELIPVLNFWSKAFLEIKDSWDWLLGHSKTDEMTANINKQNIELSKSLQILTMLKTQGSSEGAYAMIAKGIADGNEKLSQRQKLEAGQIQQAQSELDHWKQVKSILDSSGGSIDNAIEKMTKFTSMVSKGVTETHTKKNITYNEKGSEDSEDPEQSLEVKRQQEIIDLINKIKNQGDLIGADEDQKKLIELSKNYDYEYKLLEGHLQAQLLLTKEYTSEKAALDLDEKKKKMEPQNKSDEAVTTAVEKERKIWEEEDKKMEEEKKKHDEKMTELSVHLGESFGSEIGKGLATGKLTMKAAMKDLLNMVVDFLEKEELAAIASNTLQNVETEGYWGLLVGAAESAGISAIGEVAKGAISSFSTGTKNAPGGFARVHQDETIFLPAHSVVNTKTESKNMGGNGDTHFHFYGSTDSTTVDNIQSMLIEANRTGKLERFKAAIK